MGITIYALGLITVYIAHVVAFISFLYFWGGEGLDAGESAWSGAKIWMWMIAGGATLMLFGWSIDSNAPDEFKKN